MDFNHQTWENKNIGEGIRIKICHKELIGSICLGIFEISLRYSWHIHTKSSVKNPRFGVEGLQYSRISRWWICGCNPILLAVAPKNERRNNDSFNTRKNSDEPSGMKTLHCELGFFSIMTPTTVEFMVGTTAIYSWIHVCA